MTPPKRSRSITLPSAPPMIRPIATARKVERMRLSQKISSSTTRAATIENTSALRPEFSNRPKLTPRLQVRTRSRKALTGARCGAHPVSPKCASTAALLAWSRAAAATATTSPRPSILFGGGEGGAGAAVDDLGAALAQIGMPAHLADLAQDPPATLAARTGGLLHDHADIGHIGQGEAVGGRRAGLHHSFRGDAQLGEIDVAQQRQEAPGDVDLDRRLEAGADPLLRPLDFESAGDDPAQIAQLGPALAQCGVMPFGRDFGEQFEVDAALGHIAVAREPGLLRCEAEDRGEPAHQAIEGAVQHGADGAPAEIV